MVSRRGELPPSPAPRSPHWRRRLPADLRDRRRRRAPRHPVAHERDRRHRGVRKSGILSTSRTDQRFSRCARHERGKSISRRSGGVSLLVARDGEVAAGIAGFFPCPLAGRRRGWWCRRARRRGRQKEPRWPRSWRASRYPVVRRTSYYAEWQEGCRVDAAERRPPADRGVRSRRHAAGRSSPGDGDRRDRGVESAADLDGSRLRRSNHGGCQRDDRAVRRRRAVACHDHPRFPRARHSAGCSSRSWSGGKHANSCRRTSRS
jgi:hypothetical protein